LLVPHRHRRAEPESRLIELAAVALHRTGTAVSGLTADQDQSNAARAEEHARADPSFDLM
jgi:hypothetical protein